MQVKISNVITVENPSKELLNWCKENLIIANPDYSRKLRMGFWTGNTPQKLLLFERDGESISLPYGTLRQIYPILFDDAATFTDGFSAPVRVDYGKPIPLYPYQQKAVTEALKSTHGILQAPAGSGKTQMALEMVRKLGMKTLWLTHTKDLLSQSKARASRYMDDSLFGTITEGKVNIGKGITFATVQTMCRLDLPKYRDVWDVIVVDECHRCAGTPTTMTQFYKVLCSLSARYKYGLSATVHRADGLIKATYALLGDVIATVPKEAVADYVMDVTVKALNTGTKLDPGCLNPDGTVNHGHLINYLCKDTARNEFIVQLLSQQERPSLILSDRLEHLETLMKLLSPEGQEHAVMISGKMTSKAGKAEREQAIEDMRTGKKTLLFATYALAKEGLDIPCLERLYLTTPHKDYAVITQSVGRIARISEGKQPPMCYDFVDDIPYLVRFWKKRYTVYRKNGCEIQV